MVGIEAIEAIKRKLFPENTPKTNGITEKNAAFLAHITTEDFSKTGTVPNWNAGNVPMTNCG